MWRSSIRNSSCRCRKGLTADTGIDCLTHALEAGVSVHASPYTDSNAMQAIRMVFKYLPIAYEHPRDEEARSMMHNAACIAALAFSNASVGVNHALAHAFGARFGVGARPGQRAHAAARPAYNARCPPSSCRRRTSGLHRAQEVRHGGGFARVWAAIRLRRR
jgi:alcohol dehydrogenase class IV